MFFELFFTLIIILLLYCLHKFILYPYFEIRRFKSLGFQKTYFSPINGYFEYLETNVLKHKDFVYDIKMLLTQYPKTRGIATHIIGSPMLLISDSSLRKEFFQNQIKYEKAAHLSSFLHFYQEYENLVSAEKEPWKKHRRIYAKAFHYDFIVSQIPLIKDSTSQILSEIPDLKSVEYKNMFQSIAGLVILRVVFGSDFSSVQYKGKSASVLMSHYIEDRMSELLRPWLILFGKKYWRKLSSRYDALLNEYDEFIEEVIVKYVKNKFKDFQAKYANNDFSAFVGSSFLENMFKVILTKEENYTLEEAIGDCIVLFFAATDTVGDSLAYLVWYLANNPQKLEILMKEIDSVIKNDDDITVENVKKMDYLAAAIKEGLRMKTPGDDILYRTTSNDHYLKDVFIKKGTIIGLIFFATMYDPKIFKNPLEFIPERWIKESPYFDNAEEKDPFAYLPFSAGARNCIGQHLALLETKVILIKFLKAFRFQLTNKEDIVWILKFLIETEKPMMMSLTPRELI